MYIGTAVRLGFFLSIDRTAFKTNEQKDHPLFVRNKLAWVGELFYTGIVNYFNKL